MSVIYQCSNCRGTGLIPVNQELQLAQVCKECNGNGKVLNGETPFDGLVLRDDIKKVQFEDCEMRYKSFVESIRSGVRRINNEIV